MEYFSILLPLAILLFVSKILMKLCEKVKIPAVVGMLLAGILIGLINYVPGQTILTDTSRTGLEFFAKIGVVLILFSAGLETDLKKIKSIGGPAIIITCAGVVVPMALGFVVATLFNGGFGALNHDTILTNLFYGTILTATSVSVSVATLRELGKLDTKVGTTIITAAIIDDIIGIVVLSFVLALKGDGGSSDINPWTVVLKTLAYFAVVAVIALIASRFFKWLDNKYPHHRLIPIFSIAFCFFVAYASERWFGIADITGAYIVGLILSTNKDSKYINSKADILEYMIFVPIFFSNIGISTKFGGFDTKMILFGVFFIAAGMIGKVLGCGLSALACRYGKSDSFKVGIGMMARAEVALVTAQKGVEYGMIDSSIMPFIVFLIIITSFATPIILHAMYRKETVNVKSEVSL